MRSLIASVVLLLGVSFGTASAQDDGPMYMDQVRCVHLANLTEDEFGFLLVWWDGYFSRFTGSAVLSEANLEQLGGIIFQECRRDAQANIMDMLTRRFSRDDLR